MSGMELRDYFAAQIISGMHASCAHSCSWPDDYDMAKRAYAAADAMLAER